MKLKKFQSFLRSKAIDVAFFVHPDPTITYLLQAHTSYAFLLVGQRSAKVYVSKLDKITPPKGILSEHFQKQWKKQLFSSKKLRVGINKEQLSLSFFETLKKVYPKAKFVDIAKDVAELRSVKTKTEIRYIQKACNRTDLALRSFKEEYTKSKFQTEQSIALFLERKLREKGSPIAFPTIVASSVNSSVPHHETSTKYLKRGFIQLDFGATYKNYCADMSRVLFFGKPTAQERKDFELLKHCQKTARNAAKIGMAFGALDKISRKQLGTRAEYFVHSLGHGIGVEVHEAPKVGPGSKDIIKNNVVFTIEPGIYLPQKYGIRIEDTVVLQKGKLKSLTKSNRELIIL